jgi:hypothetical protein
VRAYRFSVIGLLSRGFRVPRTVATLPTGQVSMLAVFAPGRAVAQRVIESHAAQAAAGTDKPSQQDLDPATRRLLDAAVEPLATKSGTKTLAPAQDVQSGGRAGL